MTSIHKPTAAVVELLTLLGDSDLLSLIQIEAALGVHAQTTTKMLEELTAVGWVETRVQSGRTLYTLGPELPRLALAYQRRLAAEAERLLQLTQHLASDVIAAAPRRTT